VVPHFFPSVEEFRKWLRTHHAKEPELLLGFYKKGSGKGGITYQEALDEALCVGWIDGVRKNLTADSYTIRFSPRKPGSNWSEVNCKRMAELIEAKRVNKFGLAAFEARDPEKTKRYSYEARTREFDPPYLAKFQSDLEAWDFFQSQPPYYRRVATWFVMSAQRDETRARRLAHVMRHSKLQQRIPETLPAKKNKK
jgi:uncharacterized protein YdeI (YjbR/CyaY-like superfamily)